MLQLARAATRTSQAPLHSRALFQTAPLWSIQRPPRGSRSAGSLAAAAVVDAAARHRRPTPRRRRRRLAGAGLHETDVAQTRLCPVLEELQGQWADDLGLRIDVCGSEARLADGTEAPWRIQEVDGQLVLRGARLTGKASSPVWRQPSGSVWRWARAQAPGTGDDPAWEQLFHEYKAERLKIRKQLYDAILGQDFARLKILRAAWEGDFGFPLPAPHALRQRLALGRNLVPGMCFKHQEEGYRGVILACEPWCTAPATWRAQMGAPALRRGESQPFYHVALDDRDCPGARVGFLAEESLEVCEAAFPVQARLVDSLLARCEALGGYLVGPRLERRLLQQRAGGFFTV